MYRIIGYGSAFLFVMGLRQGLWAFFSFETLIYFIFMGILIYVSNAADGWEEWNDRFSNN